MATSIELSPRAGRGIAFVLLLLGIGLTASCGFRTIDTGHVGVTTLFGRLTGEQLAEGLHLVNPLKRVAEMSIRTQEIKEHADVPSSEGLIIGLETSLLYRLEPDRLPRSSRRSAHAMSTSSSSRTCGRSSGRSPPRTLPTPSIARVASRWPSRC